MNKWEWFRAVLWGLVFALIPTAIHYMYWGGKSRGLYILVGIVIGYIVRVLDRYFHKMSRYHFQLKCDKRLEEEISKIESKNIPS